MKVELEDIKFWMDAIRNSEDRDRTLESFWGGPYNFYENYNIFLINAYKDLGSPIKK